MREQPCPADIFINLHPSDFLDETLFSSDSPLATFAPHIVLEVTERAALDEKAGIAERVGRLRKLGYRIAIDDLGAGYAGLTYFTQLTPDVVKIDISLVRDINKDEVKQKLVGSLARLCKELGMRVVAEGIETAGERDTCVELGCNLLQGYLFAKPGRPYPEVAW
jgi:EAL domain-containing protein (putative c-di-GMP-specific phosphodiesterase class I)